MTDPIPMPVPPDPPDARATHRVVLRVGGKRYEIALSVETREITKGPADVVPFPEPPEDET